jgi:WhiB family redox-sensing transcriptional regulator
MTSRRTLGPLHVTRDRGEAHRVLAAIYPADLSWVDASAVCASADPEAFWPEQGTSAADIKKLCQQCPLLEPCLAYGLAHPEFGGIWGGTGTHDRKELRRKRKAA